MTKKSITQARVMWQRAKLSKIIHTWPGKSQRNNVAITSAHPHGINTSPDGANHSRPPHANLSISHFTEGKIKSYFATSRALIERGERPITKASALERLFNHRYYISQKAMQHTWTIAIAWWLLLMWVLQAKVSKGRRAHRGMCNICSPLQPLQHYLSRTIQFGPPAAPNSAHRPRWCWEMQSKPICCNAHIGDKAESTIGAATH